MIVTLVAETSGTLTSLVAVTNGSPNLDFTVTPVTCNINLYMAAGDSCQVSVVFSPRYPGVRHGAVLAKAGGQLLASALLSGIGQGSLPVLVPATIMTVAGDGQWIYQGDGMKATIAPVFLPSGLAVDAVGDLFLCDSSNNRVRRVDAVTGLISTVAGDGSPGASGDGGQATEAELNNPSGLAIDGAGNLYIADSGNNVIRQVNTISGVITTFAGEIGSTGYSGDGGVATSALLALPRGLALMPNGDLLIADSGNNVVRLVSIASNQINTIAGTGTAGYNGDGIPATQAELNYPYGVAVRSDGAIAIADMENQRVRLVNSAGVISTAAGTGQLNFAGDGGPPTEAELDGPAGVAFDPAGDLFIADSGNNRLRVVVGNPGTIETLAGNNTGQFAGDGGPSDLASLYGPYAVFLDPVGNVWLSDTFHNRVREITASLLLLTYPTMKVGNLSAPIVGSMYNGGNADLILSAPALNQAALDPATTTCNQSAMPPTALCNMGVEFAPTQVGTNITGSIVWRSNAPNITPLDSLNGKVLSVDVTTVTLTSSLNPGILGRPITLTAAVHSANTGRTGTVTFSEGTTVWCPAVALSAGGTAPCIIPSLSLGTHTFTAGYSGDVNDAASTSADYVEIIKQQPALVLTASPNPAVVNSNVMFTLTAVDQSGTPTGAVVFYDGVTALDTANLNASGIAQWSTEALSVGTHNLSAQYAGDGANINGTSNNVSEQITKGTSATVLASTALNATVGSAVTFTATVTTNNGATPTGAVSFTDGTTVLGSAQLAANGTCSITTSTLTPGNHRIAAAYAGDSENTPSNSAPVTETIQQIGTVTTLVASANPLNAGATLQLTASVSLAPGAIADGVLDGSVTFMDGATLLGIEPINSSGQATLLVSTLNVGSHPLIADFGGNMNYAASDSSVLSETVAQAATQTTLSSASSTTLMGKPATFTAVVTGASGMPAGQVSFLDGTTALGTMTLNAGGNATFSTTTLARGVHSITAKYLGNNNYLGSTSAAQPQTVLLAQAILLLTGPTSAVDAGTVAQFVANLSTPGISPTGTISILDGGSAIGTLNVTGDGSVSFSTANLAIGTHTLTASYSGDANNSVATSVVISVVVRQAGSSTALISSTNPLTQGGSLSLTATVASDSPAVSGRIVFFDGATLLGTVAVGANGKAAFSPASLSLGTHALTAVYSGDTNHATSTSALLNELVVQSTSATLSSNNNPAASGQSVTFTAQISGTGNIMPTGTATFHDNGALLAPVTLNGTGAASFTSNTLSVGSHSITMNYSGDANLAVTQAQLTETVNDAGTMTTIAASVNPATFGRPVSFTATVTSKGGMATGPVTFTVGGVSIGSGQLDANGVAVLTSSTLNPGAQTIVAVFAGDGKASPSISSPLMLSVKQTTATGISSSYEPALTLSAVSFTARVTNSGAAPATGTITFSDSGGLLLGSAPLDSTGSATVAVPRMSAGGHEIVASYPGDGSNFASVSAAYAETVQLRPTLTTVTGSAADPNPQLITLIAVVESQGSVAPGGTVTFTSGNLALGQATLGDAGVATLAVLFTLPAEMITASYSGDVNYSASRSSVTTIAIGANAQFTLSVNSQDITLVTHQHTTVNVDLGSVKGFKDTIELGCIGLPFASTCTFSPSQVKLAANGTAVASLVLDTGDPLGAGSSTNALLAHGRGTLLCWLPFGLVLGLLRKKETREVRRKLGMLLVFAIAIALSMTVTGCGGLTISGTPPGTYSLEVVGTGQGSGITVMKTITLVVTQ